MKRIIIYFCLLFFLLFFILYYPFTTIFDNKSRSINYIKRNYLFYPYFSYNPSIIKQVKYPLIYGFAAEFKWEDMCVFVSSLRANGYKGDLIIALSITKYKYLQKYFDYFNILPILIENKWPFYSSQNSKFPINNTVLKKCLIELRNYGGYKWNIYRYSILYCWLLVYGDKYSHIISSDVRDVAFQGNPFEWNFEDGLYIVDEKKENDLLIKNDDCNLNWIKMYKNYTIIENNKILNSGIFLGSKNYFFSFLSQFCEFLKSNKVIVAEQGSFNYAYYSGYFRDIKFYMNKNQRGIVLTTGIDLTEAIKLDRRNSTIYNEDRTIPLIVHQYDRSKNFTFMYRTKYCKELK